MNIERSEHKSLILSLSDLIAAIKRARLFIYAALIFSFAVVFLYLLTRPLSYTAHGIFKGHATQPVSLSKALEFLGGNEAYAPSEDPRSFLRSYPVVKRVVKSLSLQATVHEKKYGYRLRKIYQVLKTENFYRRLKKNSSSSLIQSKAVAIPKALPFLDDIQSLRCSSVRYSGELPTTLNIRFLTPVLFEAWKGKIPLGKGTLGESFSWEGGDFTLIGEGKSGKKIGILFIPLEKAIESLQKSLQVSKEKDNANFVNVVYTHSDRKLAASIVNETMRQFEEYLKSEGKLKISKQLDYLKQRQEESISQLETMLDSHKFYLEGLLDSGKIMSLEKELEYIAQKQSEKRNELQKIGSEITRNYELLFTEKPLSFEELLAFLKKRRADQTLQQLTLNSAGSLIFDYQHDLDALSLDMERYNSCLEKLKETDFDSAALSNTLKDPSLGARFEKLHTLHLKLLDAKNWTEKERVQLRSEIETEKQFMLKHIEHLKEGTLLQEKTVRARLNTLQHNLLYLLFDAYQEAEKALEKLSISAADFPTKWLHEQKIGIHTKLYAEIMEAVTKVIESKNIGYNLDHLSAKSIKPASAPLLPNPPKLLLGSLLGSIAGGLFAILFILFFEIWQGPSASQKNFIGMNRFFAPQPDQISTLGYALLQRKKVTLLASRVTSSIAGELAEWLKQRGEQVLLVKHEPDHPFTPKRLEAIKNDCDRVLIWAQGDSHHPDIIYLSQLADITLFGITNERMPELSNLPNSTLFYAARNEQEKLSLEQIFPILNRLMTKMQNSSSFLTQAFLKKFPLKKT